MLALHAAWRDGLALWAEDPARPRKRRGGTPKDGSAALHPFAVVPGIPGVRTELTLMLPSAAGGPAPSPSLWVEDAVVADRLAPWTVPAVRPADPLGVLLNPPAGVVVGDTVRFMRRIAAFALELCARGRVVPALVEGATGWTARWEAHLGDPVDAARRSALTLGMPPALRGVPVDDVLDALVDAVVRAAGVTPHASRIRNAEHALLTALTAGGPVVGGGLPELATRMARWAHGGATRSDGFRTCFRVAEPLDGGPWRVDFYLQSVEDPSLLVPAPDVWRTRGRTLKTTVRDVVDPQEKLLADLGRAARLAPVVQSSLTSARPAGMELDATAAWAFLRQSAPLLAQSGFGILAPAWWGRPAGRIGVKARATPKEAAIRSGGVGLNALVDVRWDVALGDEIIPIEELERLAELKAPLVQLRGQWVELRPEDVAAALDFYHQRGNRTMTARDLLQAGMGMLETDLPVVGVDGSGWLGDLLKDAREIRFEAVDAPPGFLATLRPYQQRGLGWLRFLDRLGMGACLADDMGLGKTVQLLALLAAERTDEIPPPTLLICPMSLVGNWQREAAKFAPMLRVAVHHGATRAKSAFEDVDLVLTTYALATRDLDVLSETGWHRVVLDEAQNIKNAHTRQAKSIAAIPAPHRVALTGTPVENRLSELWSILEFVNPGLLGTSSTFRTRFAIPIERYGDAAAAERLKRATGPFVLRRLKTDKAIISDLPDKIEMNISCTLTREQASLYQAVVDEMLARVAGLDGQEKRGAVLAAMTKLKQVCDHPALLLQDRSALPGRSGKLARLEELLDEIVANGEKALVFTQFTEMGQPLKEHLQERLNREVLFLHGGTPRAGRDALVQRFADPAGPQVFLLSLKAGGTGLNLVAANHVIHLDRWWNPAVEDQATDRAFRLGQTRNVQVRKLVCAGTLEEKIDAMIADKRALAGMVVSAGEGWLADLSTDRLRDLVALSADVAVV